MSDLKKELNINEVWEVAELLLAKQLTPAQQEAVQLKGTQDAEYNSALNEAIIMVEQVNALAANRSFRKQLQHVAQVAPVRNTPIVALPKWWKTAAIAAGVAILTSTFTIWSYRQQRVAKNQYQVLKREVQNLKASQNQLIKNINESSQAPKATASLSGTGFAISNNGYLATNYHVIEGADSIYIQTGKGFYHKAYLVAADPKADIAILKVYENSFHFSKNDLPYQLHKAKMKLGGKVYTLGYPQDEVVYNEGYVSSVNGYLGDSTQYRLVLPASPGQSGAPVLDNKGNVVGIVTGRTKESDNTATYAVSTQALNQMIKDLPKSDSIRFSNTNKLSALNREQQLEQLQQYTFMIRVYK